MTIAGAFWVGLIAARRLREWGECQDAVEGAEEPRMLAPAGGMPSEHAASMRIRTKVAETIDARLQAGGWSPSQLSPRDQREDLNLQSLRLRDVVVIEGADGDFQGDFLVDSILHLRESGQTGYVLGLVDGARQCWLVSQPQRNEVFVARKRSEHELRGEPARNLAFADAPGRQYHLARRGQASVARQGNCERPEGPRVSFYVYRATGREVLWLERWGDEVLVFEGVEVPEVMLRFMPGG